MQSELVNASQLLSAFLGGEHEKISHKIANSDFSGELKRLIPDQSDGTGVASGTSGKSGTSVNAGQTANTLNSGIPVSTTATTAVTTTTRQSVASGKKSVTTSIRKGATDAKTKVNELKSKAKTAESLLVTNSGIANTVLADLQYPAETRQAYKNLQNKEGSVSVKEIQSILDGRSSVGSAIPAEIPADHARQFVDSIVAKAEGANGNGQVSAGLAQLTSQMKTEGTYTRDEFRGLLEKIMNQVEAVQKNTTVVKQSSGSTQVGSIQTGSTQTLKAAGSLKATQTQGLTKTVLPSFASASSSENAWGTKTEVLEANNAGGNTNKTNVNDAAEASVESIPEKSKASPETVDTGSTAAAGSARRDAAAAQTSASDAATAGQGRDSAAAVNTVNQKTAGIPLTDLDSILKTFNAKVVTADLSQPEANNPVSETPGGTVEGSVAQTQNMAAQIKGAEKGTDKTLAASSSAGATQGLVEQDGMGRIRTLQAENQSDEGSLDRNAGGESNQGQKNTAGDSLRFDPKGFAAGQEAAKSADVKAVSGQTGGTDGETVVSDKTAASTGISENTPALTAFGTPDDSLRNNAAAEIPDSTGSNNDGTGLKTLQNGESKTEPAIVAATTAKAAKTAGTAAVSAGSSKTENRAGSLENVRSQAKELAADSETGGIAPQARQAVLNGPEGEGAGSAGDGSKTAGGVQTASETVRVGYSDRNSRAASDASDNGASSNSGQGGHDGQTAAKSARIELTGENAATVSKEINKQVGNRDSTLESVVSQNAAGSLRGNEINVSRMENSTQNGTSSSYDPYHMSELIQDMREHTSNSAGNHLVLEMEPSELGKISLKVEAQKDEISVMAMTQSEPAKQVLMNHSTELRQGLQDQGLVLDKFMVDVNSGRSGGQSYSRENNPGGKTTTPVSRITQTDAAKAAAAQPAYAGKTDSRSQISIFA